MPHYPGEDKEVQVDDFGEFNTATKDRTYPAVVAATGQPGEAAEVVTERR